MGTLSGHYAYCEGTPLHVPQEGTSLPSSSVFTLCCPRAHLGSVLSLLWHLPIAQNFSNKDETEVGGPCIFRNRRTEQSSFRRS